MSAERIIVERTGSIGSLIFNNPEKRNAISLEMYRQAGDSIEVLLRDPSIRVIVIKGAGDKAFVSGGDISTYAAQRSTSEQRAIYDDQSERFRSCLQNNAKPTIAMIRGYCLGGGMSLALSCDLRLCSEDAQFGIPAARLGVAFGARGELDALVDLVGPATAKEMLFTGRRYSAHEALRLGMVNAVVPAAELDGTVRNYAESIARNAPLSISAAKCIIGQRAGKTSSDDARVRRKFIDECFNSRDYVEGRTAFMEKREPVFTGR